GLLLGFGMLRFAFLDNASLIRRQLPFHFVADEGQTCLRIRLNRGIVFCGSAAASATAGTGVRYDAAESDVRSVAAQQRRQPRAAKRSLSASALQTARVIVSRAGPGAAKRM